MYEILLQYGLITITTFNVLLVVAFIVSVIFIVRYIHLKKMKLSFFVNNFAYFIIFPILGGRIFYVFEHFSLFKKLPFQAIAIWDMKISGFGIFFTAIILLYILCKREQEDFWSWIDAFILSGLTGLIFIHIGHFFNGTDYGRPTELPWGIAFDTYNIPFINPIHPTQIYSALIAFIIFAVIMGGIVKRTHLTGIAGTLGALLYSVGAFGIDFLHGSPSAYSKINYLIIAVFGIIFYIHCSHRKLLTN